MVHDRIREIVREHGRLSIDFAQLHDDASLYQAGLTSHASVNLIAGAVSELTRADSAA